jgi:beta-glucosidase
VLKKDWNFKGFVVSDWGGAHSTVKASAAGLDNEEPEDLFYGAKLKEAVQSGKVPMSEIDDHALRVLRAEFAAGLVDFPAQKSVVDVLGGLETARRIEESSIVLLKNEHNILPLDAAKVH